MADFTTHAGTAGTTETDLTPVNIKGPTFVVRNTDPFRYIFVGDTGVTTSTGFPVGPGEIVTLPLVAAAARPKVVAETAGVAYHVAYIEY